MESSLALRTSSEELSMLAYQQHSIQPHGTARVIVAVAAVMILLDLIIVGLRIWVRGWYIRSTRVWGMDDTLTVLGCCPYLASCVFAIFAAFYGLGTLEMDMVNPDALTVRGLEYFTYWQFCYALAIGFVKSSICVALLRLTPDRRYRVPLWSITVSAGCTSLGGIISLFTLCRPITANWNPGMGTCAPRVIIATLSYMISVLAIVTDPFCAVVPWFIIQKLQLPRRTRYSILIVLGLGVIASIGSAMRICYITTYSATQNVLYHYANIVLWSLVESGLGLAAGSLPPLGKLFKFFRQPSTLASGVNPPQRAGASGTIGGTPFSATGTQLDNLALAPKRNGSCSVHISSARKWDRLDDDASSRQGVFQERMVGYYARSDSVSYEHSI
ncbi:hypothetical protein BX600DRAFT_439023 [Xylariales sp. PMI_506]|nr:hypothetical protein BX600DRAFT_439023 [Xylariales sp. PMI_506]